MVADASQQRSDASPQNDTLGSSSQNADSQPETRPESRATETTADGLHHAHSGTGRARTSIRERERSTSPAPNSQTLRGSIVKSRSSTGPSAEEAKRLRPDVAAAFPAPTPYARALTNRMQVISPQANPGPPNPAHLYVPKKASSEVWNAFRLSVSDPARAWCLVCEVWLTWKKTTSNLLLHCSSWHVVDETGRISRRDRLPARDTSGLGSTTRRKDSAGASALTHTRQGSPEGLRAPGMAAPLQLFQNVSESPPSSSGTLNPAVGMAYAERTTESEVRAQNAGVSSDPLASLFDMPAPSTEQQPSHHMAISRGTVPDGFEAENEISPPAGSVDMDIQRGFMDGVQWLESTSSDPRPEHVPVINTTLPAYGASENSPGIRKEDRKWCTSDLALTSPKNETISSRKPSAPPPVEQDLSRSVRCSPSNPLEEPYLHPGTRMEWVASSPDLEAHNSTAEHGGGDGVQVDSGAWNDSEASGKRDLLVARSMSREERVGGSRSVRAAADRTSSDPSAGLSAAVSPAQNDSEMRPPFARETVELLVRDLLPPAVLDGPGFRAFALALSADSRPNAYTPIPRAALLQELHEMHASVSRRVVRLLASVRLGIALSVETWQQCSFASVSAHILSSATLEPLRVTLLVHYFGGPLESLANDSLGHVRNGRYGTGEQVAGSDSGVPDVVPGGEPGSREGLGRTSAGGSASAPDETMRDAMDEGVAEWDERVLTAVVTAMEAWSIAPDSVVAVTTPSSTLSSYRLQQRCGVKLHVSCTGVLLTRTMSSTLRAYSPSIQRLCRAYDIVPWSSESKDWVQKCRVVQQICEALGRGVPESAARNGEAPSETDVSCVISLNELLRPVAEAAERFVRRPGSVPLGHARSLIESMIEVASRIGVKHSVNQRVSKSAFDLGEAMNEALSILDADENRTAMLSSLLDPTSPARTPISGELNSPHFSADDVDLLRHRGDAEAARSPAHSPTREGPEAASPSIEPGAPDESVEQSTQGPSSTAGLGSPSPRALMVAGEVEQYIKENAVLQGMSYSTWWRSRRDKYPILSRLAARTLCIPATASPASSAFKCSAIAEAAPAAMVAVRRRGLCELSDVSPAYIQTVVFLNANLHLLSGEET